MADPSEEGRTVVEVFADVVCPFTHLGLRRFVQQRRAQRRDDLVLRVRAWPLELVNGEPLAAPFVAEEVDELRAQVAPEAFAGFDPTSFPRTSLPALALAAAGYRQGVEAGEEVSLAVREALFERGEDISAPAVLDRLAAEHGLEVRPEDEQAVRADLTEGRERGVIGSPHFFTPGGGFFCPALEVSRDDAGELHVSADPAGFDRFLHACLAVAAERSG